jgi:hypothetical protein
VIDFAICRGVCFRYVSGCVHDVLNIVFVYESDSLSFTIYLCISPDFDGNTGRAPKMKHLQSLPNSVIFCVDADM